MTTLDADVRLRAMWWALAGAVAVCAVVGLPQARYIVDGHSHALLVDGDEVCYAAKVQEAIDGHWRTASPYAWEHKSAGSLTPWGGPAFLAALARLTNSSMDSVVILTRFVAPAISALLLAAILLQLTGSPGWSVVGTSLILLEPGAYYYKPLYYLTSFAVGFPQPVELRLLYARFINPLLLIIPFLIAFRCLIPCVVRPRAATAVAAGLAIGLNFYVEPYYATYLLAWVAVALLLYLRDPMVRRTLALVLLVAALTASPAFVQNAQKFQGVGLEVVTRYGGGLHTRSSAFLLHKGVILTMLVFALCYRGPTHVYRLLLSAMLAGFVLLNQQLLTGREILNYHYNYVNAMVSLCGLVAVAHDRLKFAAQRISGLRPERWVRFAGATVLVWLVANGLVLQSRFYDAHMRPSARTEDQFPSNRRDRFERTIAWINSSAPKDAVFLADPLVAFVIPVYTHANAFLDPDLYDDATAAMSDEELFERYMIHMKMRGMTPAEVFDMVKAPPYVPFLSWKFGRTLAMKSKYQFDQAESFEEILTSNALAHDYVAAFSEFSGEMVKQGLKNYRLDYLVLSEADKRFQHTARSYFADGSLEEVTAIPEEGVQVFALSK